MNPNQFQNMGGMGRGMPNNMQQQMAMANQMNGMNGQMAGQMGQMGQMNPMANGMGRQMPQAAGQMSLNHPSVQQYIFDQLNSQGPFAGWQANVHIRERAGQIKLLVDSLRLVRPPVELSRAIEVALQFERKCFTQSSSREDYVRECSEKLGRIRDQRVQQMSQSGTGVMQAMPGMQMPNQNFMPQMPNNQQLQNNMGMPPQLQQQMQQGMRNSPAFNQSQTMMNQGQLNTVSNPAMGGMMPGNNQQTQAQLPELTPEDNKAINLRAAELAKSTPKEEMRNIVDKMNPQLRQSLAQKAVDPIIYYFRMLATREFRKRKQMETGMSGNAGQMGQGQTASNQNSMAQGINTGGNGLLGDMGRFQEQQAGGLRSQEIGEPVVPANTTPGGMMSEQMRIQQQMLARQQMGQQPQPGAGMNPAFIAQQQRIQQAQATRMQQAQLQAQNQASAQARAQAAAAAAQRGQVQGMSGSNTPLSSINRPVNPSVSGASPQTIPRPGSGTPMMAQQLQQMNNSAQPGQGQQQQLQFNMQEMQKREQALAQFPAPLQALLRNTPQNEWRNVLQRFQQNGQMKRSVSQQTPGMQPSQQPQQPAMAQMQNGAFVGGANIGAQPMQISLSAGAASQQGDMNRTQPANQGQVAPNQQEMMRQRQIQLQQQQKQQQGQGQPQQGLPNAQGQPQPRQQLTAPQMKLMDQQAVPPTVLNSIRQKANLPELKTWYQLKNWLVANPVENWTVAHVLDIQATHFQHIMKNRAQNLQQQQLQQQQQQLQQQQNNATPSHAPNQQLQQRPQAPMQGVTGQSSGIPPGQMPFKGPTPEDIAKVRAGNPRVANMPDEQIRALLINRQKQMQQKAIAQGGQQGMPQQMQFMPPQPGQMPQPGQQFGLQAPGQNQMGQLNMQAQPLARPPSGQAAGQPRPSQIPQQPENKALKRPSEDDLVEIPNQNAQAQPQARPQPFQSLTKEQFNALDPQKKQAYMNMQRHHAQQAMAKKIMDLQKEVQATLATPRPLVNMDAQSRKRITDLLTSNNVKNMLGRFESFLMAFFRMKPDEAAIKQLILHRMQLHQQYKQPALQNKIFEPADHFSLSADNVEAIVANITAKFQLTASQIPNNKAPQRPAQLTPENLSLLEAQEKERKQSIKSNQAPPAPTSTQPPFQIGDPRGQGTPRYATPGLKQEDLKLPTDTKRRKKNQQQTPVTSAPTPIATSPQATKPTKPAEMFRCPVNGCEHQLKGFATQGELDQHHNVAHKLDMEPVTDPLAFLHESLRSAFNLDENLKQIKKPKTEATAGGASTIKNETSAATPVPMSKIPSQGAPGTVAGKGGDIKMEDANDPWLQSNITLDQLRLAFGGDDWDELFPMEDKLHWQKSRLYESYRNTSPRWRKIVEGPNGALTDTSTEKSKSPEVASDKESSASAAAGDAKKGAHIFKVEDDSWNVNLDGIGNLDLSSLDDMSPFENIGDRDIIMGEDESPFELVDKSQPTTEELHFQALGGDLQHPENWTEQQKSLADFLFDDGV
ncbi:hypothetical protein H2200_008436 [Cladophialophora chaetospira]|uniref:Mediator complex subunit 15 KIX domain-containing protein n=1 Tax=Cladophialophora chaetospira TaxID=386627 RepID=A0AA38X5R9_9EURO|nr:hypothetical protein H2200_008436 [Cladophialophora chaetospira]